MDIIESLHVYVNCMGMFNIVVILMCVIYSIINYIGDLNMNNDKDRKHDKNYLVRFGYYMDNRHDKDAKYDEHHIVRFHYYIGNPFDKDAKRVMPILKRLINRDVARARRL